MVMGVPKNIQLIINNSLYTNILYEGQSLYILPLYKRSLSGTIYIQDKIYMVTQFIMKIHIKTNFVLYGTKFIK
jgi:hypothetical protein